MPAHIVKADPRERVYATVQVTFDEDGVEHEVPGTEQVAYPVRCVDCRWNHTGTGATLEEVEQRMTELHQSTRKARLGA